MFGDLCYRALLIALPSDLLRDFGEDMVQMFRDQRRLLAGRPLGALALWALAIGDVIAQALTTRIHGFGRTTSWGAHMRASIFDFRHGLRLVRRYPASSALAIATLALGIGANTAIFSVVDAVLLQELPYPEPDRIVTVWEKRPREGVMTNSVAAADFLDWRRRNAVFQSIAAVAETSMTLTGDGDPAQVPAGAVSWGFFDVLGVRAAIGRTFIAADEVDGTHRQVVITHGFWQRRYGGDAGVLGRTIQLNGVAWQIVGVLPADFAFLNGSLDLWVPLLLDRPGAPAPSRALHQLKVYARLKPDVTLTRAVEQMHTLGVQLEKEHPDTNTGHGIHVMPTQENYVEAIRPSLIAIAGGVGLVLLIACVNVANLLLARAASRRREMAVRAALGASRLRLITQSFVESVSLACLGGLAGLGIAELTLRALPAILPERLSIVSLDDLQINARLMLFALGLSALTGIIFGLLPALQASRPSGADALAQGGRSAAGIRRRSRVALVVSEVALATLTLVGAGLVLRSFNQMLAQPLGFTPGSRLTATLSVGAPRYPDADQRRQALEHIEQSLAAIPGVAHAGAIDMLPMGGINGRQGMVIEGREVREGDPPTRMHPRVVTPDYFKAMDIAITSGRAFTPQDDGRALPVVIISEMAARQFWPGVDPIGRRVRYGGDETWRTVVGIARDVRHWGRRDPINPMIYRPQAQVGYGFLTFVISTSGDPALLGPVVRARVAAVDPNLPIVTLRTMDDVVARSFRADRSLMVLMTAFGVLALVLAVIGIYGVMSQVVLVRVPEIGVRMSLGARPVDILRGVLAEGVGQAAIGLAIGLLAGAWLMKFASTLLFEVQPWDPPTLAGVGVVLVTAALAACLIPARRAMRVDPVEALRQ
jgi:predicted permease